jgi:thioredoxin reductase (NADPH)
MISSNDIYDVAVIGAGPAGISAAVYTARAGLKTVIFGDHKKSNLAKAHIVSNYFGVVGNPSGLQLAEQGVAQLEQFKAQHQTTEIIDFEINGEQKFILKDSQRKTYCSKTVILATGQSYPLSGIAGEKEYTGKGLSYCVTCDGFFFKNKKVVVVGGGDFAAEEALELLNYTKYVTILSHGKPFEFSGQHKELLEKNQIIYQETAKLKAISGQEKVEEIEFADGKKMLIEGIFMGIGSAGAGTFAKKLGLETEGNYIKINQNGQTNLKGIFAAGDCTGQPAQVAVSVGGGCIAALSAIKSLQGVSIYIQYN